MLKATFSFAIVLILLGVGFYLGSGRESFTPLIPAFIGVLIGLSGGVATLKSPSWAKPVGMHAALVFALLGLLGSAMGVPKLIAWLTTGEAERPLAVVLMNLTALLLLVYLVLGVRSFVAARKARSAADAPADAAPPTPRT